MGAVQREQHTANSIHINYFCYLWSFASSASSPETLLSVVENNVLSRLSRLDTCRFYIVSVSTWNSFRHRRNGRSAVKDFGCGSPRCGKARVTSARIAFGVGEDVERLNAEC